MRIAFRSRSFDLTQALRAHARQSLLYAVGRFNDAIEDVVVRFSDLNGPRGGIDKMCRFDARLVRGPVQRVEDVDHDLYAAIDRAAGRLGRSVARAVERNRRLGAGRRTWRTREAAWELPFTLVLPSAADIDPGPETRDEEREDAMKSDASVDERAETGLVPVEAPLAKPSADDIARRAYEIYIQRGHASGDPLQDWLQAEAELTAKL